MNRDGKDLDGNLILVCSIFATLFAWGAVLLFDEKSHALRATADALERLPATGGSPEQIWGGHDVHLFGYARWVSALVPRLIFPDLNLVSSSVIEAGPGEWNVSLSFAYTYRNASESLIRSRRTLNGKVKKNGDVTLLDPLHGIDFNSVIANDAYTVSDWNLSSGVPLSLTDQIELSLFFLFCLVRGILLGLIAGVAVGIVDRLLEWRLFSAFFSELALPIWAGVVLACAVIMSVYGPLIAFGSIWGRVCGLLVNVIIVSFLASVEWGGLSGGHHRLDWRA